MSAKITGLLDWTYGENGYCSFPEYTDRASCEADDGTWNIPWPPVGYVQYKDSVQIGYTSNALPANYTDRFYVSDTTLGATPSGTLAATVSDGSVTTVLLTGLQQGREYHVRAYRFDGSGIFTGEVSNKQWVKTASDEITVTPASVNRVADWSVDKFSEWFSHGGSHVTIQKLSDGVLGNFIRLVNDSPELAVTGLGLDGKKFLSPRHDWAIEIPCRISYTPSAENQFQVGFNSGCQNVVAIEVRDGHAVQTDKETAAGIANVLTGPDATNGRLGLWGTMYGAQTDTTHKGASTAWRLTPSSADAAEYPKWYMPDNGKQTLKYIYTASDKTLRVYLHRSTDASPQDLLLVELGSTHDLISQRKKFPQGDYPLPITPSMRFQDLTYGNNVTIDIGSVKVTSACPMEYAGFAVELGHHGSYSIHTDAGTAIFDPSSHTLSNFRFWQGVSSAPVWKRRYTTHLFAGYTVPKAGIAYDAPIFTDSPGVYSQDLTVGKTQFIPVPAGKSPRYFSLQGLNQYGAILPSGNVGIEGRLLDENDQPITAWTQISGVYDQPLLEVPTNTATRVRAEVRMQYNGAAITDTTSAVGEDFESPRPNTPSLFVGFEVYFDGSTQTEPALTADGNLIGCSVTNGQLIGVLSANSSSILVAATEGGLASAFNTLSSDSSLISLAATSGALVGNLVADNSVVSVNATTGSLVGNLVADNSVVSVNATTGALVGNLISDNSVIDVITTLGQLIGTLSADISMININITEGELSLVLTGAGSIRSPSGQVLDLRDINGNQITIAIGV